MSRINNEIIEDDNDGSSQAPVIIGRKVII